MSALGQSRRFGPIRATSALPPIASIERTCREVRLVPIGDIESYSITSSASASNVGGMSRLSAFAAFRLSTNSNLLA